MDNKFEYIKSPIRELPPELMLPEINITMEQISEEDREYIKQMYPAKARLILALVEDECDKLEYEGSPMFAVFPDKESALKIARDIYQRIGDADNKEIVETMNIRNPYQRPNPLMQLIEVLVCQEFYCRRNRYRNRRRFF